MNSVEVILNAVAILFFVIIPVSTVWGWVRAVRIRRFEGRTVASVFALLLAALSQILGISTIAYAHHIGGFAYYDRRLLRIYRIVAVLSFAMVILAVVGATKKNPLRWLSLISAVTTTIAWMTQAEGE